MIKSHTGSKNAAIFLALTLVTGVFASSGAFSTGLNSLTGRIADSVAKASSSETKAKVTQQLSKIPLSFIENQGQVDTKVSHYLQGAGTSVYFTAEGLTYSLQDKANADSRYALKLGFVGANQVAPTSVNQTEATINYFKGNKDEWKTGVPTSSGLKYTNLWPGIDLVYSGTGQKLKYDFHVAPGADPSQIKLAYEGATSLKVNGKGQLQVKTPAKVLTDDKPFTYQQSNGEKVRVESSYALSQDPKGSQSYGFSVGNYDRTKPLVIDPVMFVYSGFIGGEETDQAEAVAVDSSGAAYVTGITTSPAASLPLSGGPDLTPNGGNDVFVAKVNPAGTGLVYAGFIGGSGDDRAFGIGVDSAGAAYVAGTTDSTEASATPFPLTVGPDLTFNGVRDAYVAKVNPAGTGLAYSGYIGGAGSEGNQIGVAVSAAGNAYVTGIAPVGSDEFSFPIVFGPDLIHNGSDDAFVAKVNLLGNDLDYAGFIGGSLVDSGLGIALDSSGAAYVTGSTTSTDATFPDLGGPDLTQNGNTDAFVAKVKPNGTGLIYAGYIGGSAADIGNGIAVDASGAAYVGGQTASNQATFPDAIGPDLTPNGSTDAFVAKVASSGTVLSYAGYIGGSGIDIARGIAVDSTGAAYLSGETQSGQATFPVSVGPNLTHDGGPNDGFIAKVNQTGTALNYAGYLGGEADDFGRRVALDSAGNAYVVGMSQSDEVFFPVAVGPDVSYNGGLHDAFVSKISNPTPIERTADFNGNGSTDVAVYRNGTWYFQTAPEVNWGGDATDRAVPADYNGDGTTDIAVYRVSTGTWYVKDQFTIQYGGDPADIPVPADYNGDGVADLAVYRNGFWHIRNVGSFSWGGAASDIAVPGDYNNDGIQEMAVYRKATGIWYIRNYQPSVNLTVQWGGDGSDIPVPGDYNNDGATDLGVFRKATGTWYTKNVTGATITETGWGGHTSDVPVPGDYDNNGTTDIAVYRKDTGYWYVMGQFETSWGGDPADKALPLPSAIRD